MGLTEAERKAKFFYAEYAARMYDTTIDLVVPQYRVMHETMLELLKQHFQVTDETSASRISGTILDVGVGTGAESIAVMRTFPNIHIVGLDICPPMQAEFKTNVISAFGASQSVHRYTFVLGDIVGEGGDAGSLRAILPDGQKGYVAVISAFALHHLSAEEKEEAYRRIYDVLVPGGILVNGDLFTFHSRDLAKYAENYDREWISKQFDRPTPQFSEATAISEEFRQVMQSAWQDQFSWMPKGAAENHQELKDRWLAHYQNDNILGPIEPSLRQEHDSGNRSELGQAEMLKRVGFREIGCPFRFWQVGILWAKK